MVFEMEDLSEVGLLEGEQTHQIIGASSTQPRRCRTAPGSHAWSHPRLLGLNAVLLGPPPPKPLSPPVSVFFLYIKYYLIPIYRNPMCRTGDTVGGHYGAADANSGGYHGGGELQGQRPGPHKNVRLTACGFARLKTKVVGRLPVAQTVAAIGVGPGCRRWRGRLATVCGLVRDHGCLAVGDGHGLPPRP